MNKQDLIQEVANVVETKKQAQEAVDRLFTAIQEALAGGSTVSIAGFGSFKVQQRKARTGRNPQTGEEIRIEAKRVPKFVPGKALKDAVE